MASSLSQVEELPLWLIVPRQKKKKKLSYNDSQILIDI